VKYCPTADNYADVLTKALPAAVHRRHADALMNCSTLYGVTYSRGCFQPSVFLHYDL